MATLSRRNALVMLSAAPIASSLTWWATQAQQTSATPAYAQTDPALNAKLNLPVPANPSLPTLFLVGDSTVRNGRGDGANNQMGWGEPLVAFFDPRKIKVVNRAIGGRSSRTYLTEGHWADVLAMLKPGDTVLFQFGHNDTGAPDEPTRARASLPGIGEEALDINNPITKKPETVHTFGWYVTTYVKDTLAKRATPILCSLIPRKIWKDGKVVRADDNFGGWTRQVAATQKVGFIDLNHIIADRYDAMGEVAVEPLFGDPHTHTTLAGAQLNAECVVAGLKALKHDPVAAYFSAAGMAIKPAGYGVALSTSTPKT
jgi:lysophospholipase L1-like esterase